MGYTCNILGLSLCNSYQGEIYKNPAFTWYCITSWTVAILSGLSALQCGPWAMAYLITSQYQLGPQLTVTQSVPHYLIIGWNGCANALSGGCIRLQLLPLACGMGTFLRSLSMLCGIHTFGFLQWSLQSAAVGIITAGAWGKQFSWSVWIGSRTIVRLAPGCLLLGLRHRLLDWSPTLVVNIWLDTFVLGNNPVRDVGCHVEL